MLDKTDIHRMQVIVNFDQTFQYGHGILENHNAEKDFDIVFQAIKNGTDLTPDQLPYLQNFTFELPEEEKKKFEEFVNTEHFEDWLPIFDDREAHF